MDESVDPDGCTVQDEYRFWVLFIKSTEMHAYSIGRGKFEAIGVSQV